LRHVLALKILAALAYMGCAWLVYRIVQQHSQAWAIVGTVAFAWSPLTLLESVQNGHNDIVMVLFLLMAVWTLGQTSRRLPCGVARLLSCLFLALSVLVKFVTIIAVPFFLIGMVKDQKGWLRRLGLMLGYGAVVAVLVACGLLPLWPGWRIWAVVQAGGKAGRSLLALLVFGLEDSLGVNPAFDLSLKVVLGLFGLIYLCCLGWFLIRFGQASLPVPTNLLPSLVSFFVLFWYVLLAAPVFHAWYLLWFLPLASLLLPYRRPFAATTVFSVTALFALPYFETVRKDSLSGISSVYPC
jgi:4-amino-4-deoxy-L-arabinose transferase-like glycosyltransferase